MTSSTPKLGGTATGRVVRPRVTVQSRSGGDHPNRENGQAGPARTVSAIRRRMTIKRLDHVSVVVDDLAAAIAFFTVLGMTIEGRTPVEGPWVDRINGLEGVQVDIVMMR